MRDSVGVDKSDNPLCCRGILLPESPTLVEPATFLLFVDKLLDIDTLPMTAYNYNKNVIVVHLKDGEGVLLSIVNFLVKRDNGYLPRSRIHYVGVNCTNFDINCFFSLLGDEIIYLVIWMIRLDQFPSGCMEVARDPDSDVQVTSYSNESLQLIPGHSPTDVDPTVKPQTNGRCTLGTTLNLIGKALHLKYLTLFFEENSTNFMPPAPTFNLPVRYNLNGFYHWDPTPQTERAALIILQESSNILRSYLEGHYGSTVLFQLPQLARDSIQVIESFLFDGIKRRGTNPLAPFKNCNYLGLLRLPPTIVDGVPKYSDLLPSSPSPKDSILSILFPGLTDLKIIIEDVPFDGVWPAFLNDHKPTNYIDTLILMDPTKCPRVDYRLSTVLPHVTIIKMFTTGHFIRTCLDIHKFKNRVPLIRIFEIEGSTAGSILLTSDERFTFLNHSSAEKTRIIGDIQEIFHLVKNNKYFNMMRRRSKIRSFEHQDVTVTGQKVYKHPTEQFHIRFVRIAATHQESTSSAKKAKTTEEIVYLTGFIFEHLPTVASQISGQRVFTQGFWDYVTKFTLIRISAPEGQKEEFGIILKQHEQEIEGATKQDDVQKFMTNYADAGYIKQKGLKSK